MTYNIHPMVVHFPVALLLFYSIIKILPWSKWFPNVSWKHIERALLLAGVLGAFVSLSTGEVAEHLTNPNEKLVEMHAFFAGLSTWLYGALLAGEFLTLVSPWLIAKQFLVPLMGLISWIQKILTHITLSKFIAFFGLIAISITGLLGGVMVYGTTADPLANVVLKILGINL